MSNRLLNTFFHLLYNDLAWAYDFVSWIVSLGLWDSWVRSIAMDINHSPVLETGFGPGHLLARLRSKGLNAVGIDASYQMSRLAGIRGKKISNRMDVINGYAQFLPFPSRSFSTIVATFPSNYILDPATWLEFKRILRPDGVVYWLPAAWINHTSLPYRLAAWLFRITHQVPEDRPGQNPERFEMLEKLGFNVFQEFRPIEKSVVWIVRATNNSQEK